MSDTKNEKDQERGDEVLKRMLAAPPKKHVNDLRTKPVKQNKQGGNPGKNDRPAKS
jgi:hypothetical protein